MMKRFDLRPKHRVPLLGVALVGAAMLGPAHVADSAAPTGVWLVQDGIARVRTDACGLQGVDLCDYAVWLQAPLDDQGQPRCDVRTPNPNRKQQPVLGHRNLMGRKPTGANAWESKVYIAENGGFCDVTVAFSPRMRAS